MSAKIDKIIARLQEKISSQQYYEAHQQTRVVASRYIKANPPSYSSAINILFSVANSLLGAGQDGSGGDLALFMIEVYCLGEVVPDAVSKGRVFTLLRGFKEGEPVRKRVIDAGVSWTAKFSPYPAGDPELHHIAGSIYASEADPYPSERHLLLGSKDSPPILINLHYEWYTQDTPHTAPLYLSRSLLPYLLIGNLRHATLSYTLFISRLKSSNPGLTSYDEGEISIFPSLPLMNFLGLLLISVRKGDKSDWEKLRTKYKGYLKEGVTGELWDEALIGVGEMYFGVRRVRQGNPLLDMMGSMFGGGMGGGGAAQGGPKRIGTPAVEGLD